MDPEQFQKFMAEMGAQIMALAKLTESEEIVMKSVWDSEKEPVLSDVVERVNSIYEKNWKPQTVSTFLAKLVQKRYLELQREGKIYSYKILVSETDYKRKLYLQHVHFWYHNDMKEFVMSMIENGDLSREALDKLTD